MKIPLPKRKPPRPEPREAFDRKFGRNVAYFGSREKKEIPSYRWLWATLLAFLCAILLWVAVLCVGRLWKVRDIVVTDGTLYSAAAILEYADIEVGDELLGFDSRAVKERLREGLPLLDDIKVRKSPTGRVTIKFAEQTDLYYTRHHMNYYILSATTREVLCVASNSDEARRVGAIYLGVPEATRVRVGEELSFVVLPYAPESTPAETYYEYEAETEEPEVEYAYVLDFEKTLREHELWPRVTGMELGDRYDLCLVLDGSILVELGNMDELERKLTLVSRTLTAREEEGLVDPNLPTLVDVSDPTRIIHRAAPDIELPHWAG